MNKKLKALMFLGLLSVLLILSGYLLLGKYYSEGFGLNTWINGVYCTGKSVEEVNAELLSGIEAPIVVVTDPDGNEYKLDLSKMDYKADYTAALEGFMEEQKPYLWIENISLHRNLEMEPVLSYDAESLRNSLYMIEAVKEASLRPEEFQLSYSAEDGYQLYDGLSGRYDAEKAFDKLVTAIAKGETAVDLGSPDCYYDVPLTEEQQSVKKLWSKLEKYYQCDIVYDMGAEQIEFTPGVLSGFLLTKNERPILDREGNLVLNEEAVEAYIKDLARQYDTYKQEREFQSTRGDIVTVKGGTYGTQLDQKAEITFLMENLLAENMHTGTVQKHIPEYTREAYARGLNDIGGTYIEIDITEQKLYCYKDGSLEIETDIVTGNKRRGMSTTEGVYYVYAKQTDRILRGEGYASPVDYWMPVNGGIGIHDADWRNKFGGEIYKTNGSHGCINVPPEVMPDIYEMMEVGTPVIIFN